MLRRKLKFERGKPVKLPNGRTIKISVVHHPGAVVIIPFLNKDTVMMMRQFRPALNQYIYELPAGTLDADEPPALCARRELIEETGLKAGRLVTLGAIYPVPGYSTEVIHIFKATCLAPTTATPEDYEVIETMPMTKSQIKKMFKTGKLMDAKSISAFAFCRWL